MQDNIIISLFLSHLGMDINIYMAILNIDPQRLLFVKWWMLKGILY